MAGAGLAVETFAQCGNFDESRIGAIGIKFLDGGREKNIRAFGSSQRAVGLEGAGVAREVLVGAELRGVDEEADGDVRTGGASGANERRVACVQSAHGGNKAESVAASGAQVAGPVAQFSYGAKNLHQARFTSSFISSRVSIFTSASGFTTASASSRVAAVSGSMANRRRADSGR